MDRRQWREPPISGWGSSFVSVTSKDGSPTWLSTTPSKYRQETPQKDSAADMATIEAFGGPQPATHDRYGALFAGGSWGFRPRLAFNGGTIRSYTGGSPRAQYMFGFIYTVRPGLTPPRGSGLGHLLGR